jgi:hypothetical protein
MILFTLLLFLEKIIAEGFVLEDCGRALTQSHNLLWD